jgi:chorismate mutase
VCRARDELHEFRHYLTHYFACAWRRLDVLAALDLTEDDFVVRKRVFPVVLLSVLVPVIMAFETAGTAIASTPPSSAGQTARRDNALGPLVDLVAQRLETADIVASAKFGTSSPIDDPAREKVVLDNAASMATQQGLDPEPTRRVFSDQIQANKVVQYGLFSVWTSHPDEAPTTRADLNRIRPTLDRITVDLVHQLAATQKTRSGQNCDSELRSARRRVERAHDFDTLHTDALARALTSVCG